MLSGSGTVGDRSSFIGGGSGSALGINNNAEIKSISTNRASGFNIRAMSRGKANIIAKQITKGSMVSF
jgi:hypothetical protein